MLKREDFIGTIMGGHLITGVAGEGATGVVFIVATLDDPTKSDKVIKMYKPLNFLEMDVLHYSFKIHKELYPNHHLIMSKKDREIRLSEEMLKKAKKPGIIYRLNDINELYNQTIEVLAQQYYDGYRSNNLGNDFLIKNPAISIFVDPILQNKISEYLDEGLIEDQFIDFFEFLKEQIDEILNSDGIKLPIKTVSHSVLSNLLGLFLEGFISQEETKFITQTNEFTNSITVGDLETLFYLMTIFYHRTKSELENLKKQENSSNKDEDDEFNMENYEFNAKKNKIENKIVAINLGFELLTEFSLNEKFYNEELAGLGYLWSSQALKLKNNDALLKTCKEYLNKSIELFTKLGSITNLHDAYSFLAEILQNEDKTAAKRYIEMAKQIRMEIDNSSNNTAANNV